jgi:PPK2 family polyphosphate:nucleotide phosphotransferase
MHIDRYRVKPGQQIQLEAFDPQDSGDFVGNKDKGGEILEELNQALEKLQELLYAEHKHKLLIILQGMDTSGKDGVIRHVFDGVNPQGVRVASFKVPTPLELDHDFLWRIHQQAPARGEMVIFNRSHYEDVLVVRVHELVPPNVWHKRYQHINNFEKLLSDEGTIILKFFLHISKAEQKGRLLDRLKEPDKRWKFNPGDLKERLRWDEYTRAYEDAISQTSTEYAPWFIVPANRKWYRNLVIASLLVDTLKELNPQPPEALQGIDSYRSELERD